MAVVTKRLLSRYVGFVIWYEHKLSGIFFTVSVYRIYFKSATSCLIPRCVGD